TMADVEMTPMDKHAIAIFFKPYASVLLTMRPYSQLIRRKEGKHLQRYTGAVYLADKPLIYRRSSN
ncbi:MAG: hypothetical protein P4M15_06150, partial [Alphaproteobacteria bacterium]|nr:hypothetical protein [Alphaproteobacteria bacterium]